MILSCDAIGIAVLAAGASRRMGKPKLLLPFAGSTLLARAVAVARASGVGEVAVVTGAYARQMEPLLERLDVRVVENARWDEGQASSVRAAVSWARGADLAGLILMVADQPFVTAQHLQNLAATARTPLGYNVAAAPAAAEHAGAGAASGRLPDACVTAHAGRTGNPAYFSSRLFPQLEALEGDEGARVLLRAGMRTGEPAVARAESASSDVFDDVDDEEGYRRASEKAARGIAGRARR